MTESELAHLLYDLYSKNIYHMESYEGYKTVHRSFFFNLPGHKNLINVFEAAIRVFPKGDEAIYATRYSLQDGTLELVRDFKIPFRYDLLYKGNAKGKYLTGTAEAELLLALKEHNIKVRLNPDHRNSAHRRIEDLVVAWSEFWKNACGKFTKKAGRNPYL